MNVSRKVFINRQRFKNALKLQPISMKELSRQTDIPYDTLRFCVQRENIMPDLLETICKYLDVSALYIQGKQTEKALLPDQIRKEYAEMLSDSDDDEISWIISDQIKRIDSDGNRIPRFFEGSAEQVKNAYKQKKEAERDFIINYLVDNYSASAITGNRSRKYFENHYSQIKSRIDETITAYVLRHKENED